MTEKKDNYTYEDGNSYFELAISSSLGDRDEQQDAAGWKISEEEGIVILCDGMGGHQGGAKASRLAVETFLEDYEDCDIGKPDKSCYVSMAKKADRRISSLRDDAGNLLMAGTTVVSVYLCERMLQWLSVGDSRIYLCRGEDFIQITTDHNYGVLMESQLESGQITTAQYTKEMEQSNVLISFLGMGGISYIDANQRAFILKQGDVLLLTTDGLYKLLSDQIIQEIVTNFKNPHDAAQALRTKAERTAGKYGYARDNTTFAIIKVI